jgi:glycosyltransferase involved in cell wall biosynthesis
LYKVSKKSNRFIKKFQIAIGWRRAVKKYFLEANPDVVHCHLSVAHTLVSAINELKAARIFYTVHSDPDKYWENGKNMDEQKAIKRFLAKNNMTFIALHSDAVHKIKKYYGDNCEIRTLNNAVKLESYKTTPEKKAKVRADLEIPETAFLIGHVGRFLPVKNHKFLLCVFKKIVERTPNAVLCLVGDGEKKEEIKQMAIDMSLENKVLFLGNRNDVYRIMSAFDAFVLPSVWEGFPMTLIEAQGAGVPCFVSDSVSRSVELTNLVTFIDLDAGDEHWSQTILEYKQPEYIEYGLREYDINNVINRLLAFYGLK